MNNIILSYHRVLPEDLAKERGILSVTQRNFHEQIKYLFKFGWTSITLKYFFFEYLKKKNVPHKKVIITFDDGYRDNYKYAFPILKKYNFRATFFLTAGFIDSDRVLNFDENKLSYKVKDCDFLLKKTEIEEMMKFGNEFGSHTITHPMLTKISLEKAELEINKSKEILESYLGTDIISFCYPYGNLNKEIVHLVKKANYKIGVITPSKAEIQESVFTLRRTGIYLNDGILRFILKNTRVFYKLREMKYWKLLKKYLFQNA